MGSGRNAGEPDRNRTGHDVASDESHSPGQCSNAGGDAVADKAMQVLIAIRQHLRKKKDFESADLLRNLLAEQKITLEDRPDGTIWRAE